jgi:hypothetical protein
MLDIETFREGFQETASFSLFILTMFVKLTMTKKWGDTAVAVSPRFITGW